MFINYIINIFDFDINIQNIIICYMNYDQFSYYINNINYNNINLPNKIINYIDKYGNNFLHYSCALDNFKLTKFLLNQNFNINIINPINTMTPLHYACLFNNFNIVKLLVKYNVNINISTWYLETPIFFSLNNILITKFLIQNNARIDLPNIKGEFPFDIIKKKKYKTKNLLKNSHINLYNKTKTYFL